VPHCTAPSGKFFGIRGEYFTMSNGVFNFNFLALVLSEIIEGSQIYTRGPYAPWTPPSAEFFCAQSEYFTISNCVFNFNILALVVSEILWGPEFTLGDPVPPVRPLTENFVYPRRVLYYVKWGFSFQLSSSFTFRDIRGSQIYTRVPYAPWTPPGGEICIHKASTSQYLIVFLISTF